MQPLVELTDEDLEVLRYASVSKMAYYPAILFKTDLAPTISVKRDPLDMQLRPNKYAKETY